MSTKKKTEVSFRNFLWKFDMIHDELVQWPQLADLSPNVFPILIDIFNTCPGCFHLFTSSFCIPSYSNTLSVVAFKRFHANIEISSKDFNISLLLSIILHYSFKELPTTCTVYVNEVDSFCLGEVDVWSLSKLIIHSCQQEKQLQMGTTN